MATAPTAMSHSDVASARARPATAATPKATMAARFTEVARARHPALQRGHGARRYRPTAMRHLVALALPGGPDFVAALRRAWDGGDAVVVLDRRLPPAAQEDVVRTLGVSSIVAGDGTTT